MWRCAGVGTCAYTYRHSQEALDSDTTYMGNLSRSMSLVLDEFYSCLRTVGVSSVTGEGFDDLFTAIDESVAEYYEHYVPILEQMRKDKERKAEAERNRNLEKSVVAARSLVLVGEVSGGCPLPCARCCHCSQY